MLVEKACTVNRKTIQCQLVNKKGCRRVEKVCNESLNSSWAVSKTRPMGYKLCLQPTPGGPPSSPKKFASKNVMVLLRNFVQNGIRPNIETIPNEHDRRHLEEITAIYSGRWSLPCDWHKRGGHPSRCPTKFYVTRTSLIVCAS